MKKVYIAFAIGIFVTTIVILLLQNSALQQQINSVNNTMNTNPILNEYEKQFGNITVGYGVPSMPLDGKIYVVEGTALTTDTQANDSYTVKMNHTYLVEAHLARMDDVKPSLIYYVCHIQVLNSTDYLVESGWGDMVLIPKHDSSNCALQWIPTKPGNYTAQAFASEDEIGTDTRMEHRPEVHIHVLP